WQRLAFLAPDLAYAMSETRAANNKLRGLLSKGATFLDKAGVAGAGLLGTAAFGSKFVLNVDQALAADRVSLFLLARLGVDVEQVPDFWRGIYQYAEGDTALDKHFGLRPGLTEREEAFQSAIAEINAKDEAGEPLTPDRSCASQARSPTLPAGHPKRPASVQCPDSFFYLPSLPSPSV